MNSDRRMIVYAIRNLKTGQILTLCSDADHAARVLQTAVDLYADEPNPYSLFEAGEVTLDDPTFQVQSPSAPPMTLLWTCRLDGFGRALDFWMEATPPGQPVPPGYDHEPGGFYIATVPASLPFFTVGHGLTREAAQQAAEARYRQRYAEFFGEEPAA